MKSKHALSFDNGNVHISSFVDGEWIDAATLDPDGEIESTSLDFDGRVVPLSAADLDDARAWQKTRMNAWRDSGFSESLALVSGVARPTRARARHKAASKHRVSKPTGEMKPAQINAELDKLDALVSQINDRMIADGRGYETSEQTWQASDPLALEWQAASQRRMDLLREIERRYQGGPSFRAPSRFPSGWRTGR